MRILFFSDNFPPESNALTARLYEHAMHWINAGHEVTVVTCAPNFPEGRLMSGYKNRWRQVENMDGIRVVRVKSYMSANEGFLKRTMDFVSFMITGAFFGLLEKKPDVIVATSPQFFCALGGMIVAFLRRRPFVLEVRDLWPDSIVAVGAMRRNLLIRAFECMERFLYKRADAIVTVTRGLRKSIVEKGVGPEKVHIVINGVDLTRYTPREPDASLLAEHDLSGKFVVGYIGTHGVAHALEGVLRAADLLRDRHDIAFIFAGAGAARAKLEQIVEQQSLSNVRLIPRQSKEYMPRLWSICSLALVPLRNSKLFASAIPSKIFEAMGMGIPLLLSVPEGEATQIVIDADVGLCVPPEDPEALATTIRRLADDPARLERLRVATRAAAPTYSRQAQAAHMATVLDAVCGR